MAKQSLFAKYSKMTTTELGEATAEFDREMVIDKARPLNAKERALWNKARRLPGRPRRGKGVKVISVSIEKELLSRSDVLARSLGISRALLIERGMKAVLAAEGRL